MHRLLPRRGSRAEYACNGLLAVRAAVACEHNVRMNFDVTRTKVHPRGALIPPGRGAHSLERAVARNDVERIHRGWYVERGAWDAAYSEERHLMRVIAVAESMRGTDAVFFLSSAAVLWGLPLFRMKLIRVHVSGCSTNGIVSNAKGVARHEIHVPDTDRAMRFGIPCTSLERTVYDLIRLAPLETALACADAALRMVAWDATERTYNDAAAREWLAGMWERVDAARGARGIRQARQVLGLADGRAQLPGESVSRLYLLDLGFAPPRLQVPVPGPNGHDYYVDFGLEDVSAWGEFDGKGKYELGANTPAHVLDDEKQREDWIRGTTRRPFARWGMEHITSAITLGRRLAKFHIIPPR